MFRSSCRLPRSSAKVVVCAGVNFPEGRKLRVAVVGGGPAGASAADQLAKAMFDESRKTWGNKTIHLDFKSFGFGVPFFACQNYHG